MPSPAKKFILNGWFLPLFVLLTPVLVLLLGLLVVVQGPFISRRSAMRKFRVLIKVYGKIVIAFAYPWLRVRYEATSRSPPTAIYICNHRSSCDPFLMAFLPGELIQWVNIWPFRLPILGPFARLAGYLSVRQMTSEEAIARSAKLLREGCSIIAFPEGTRAVERKMGPFHGLAFRLALQTGYPIVPICISGSEDKPCKGSLALNPGIIRVRQLAPLTGDEYRGLGPFKLKRLVHERIRSELERMEKAV